MAIENTTTTKAVTSGTQLTSIGTVKMVVGIVKAVDANGTERVLQVGDKVYANETIFTSADGAVIVEFLDGTHLDLPRSTHIVLDADIYSPKASIEQQAADEAARIEKAIAEGRDPTLVTDAAAAGGTIGDEGSSVPLVIDFNNTQGNVTSGYPTGPISVAFPPPTEELPPVPPVEGVAPAPVPPAISVSVGVGIDIGGGGQEEPGIVLIPGGTVIPIAGVTAIDIPEGSGGGSHPVAFLITLSQVSATDITITYHINSGTASNPEDYFDGAVTGTVTIPAGFIGFTITENIVEDFLVEGNESFTLALSNPIGATLTNNTATVTIVDDDHAPVALDDTASMTEDDVSVSGNVLPNDTDADGPTLSVVGTPITLTNEHGTLVITSATGEYTFTMNSATQAAAQALDTTDEPITMVFQNAYKVTDGANESNLADATITINGTNDVPTITADPGNEGGNDVVFESGLAAGSAAVADSEFASGTFTVSDADGLDDIQSVTINGVTVAIGSLVGQSFAGTNGTLTVTAYSAGIASYTYELTSPTTDVAGTETDVFTLTTSDGTATSLPATIIIDIIDDVPTARADTDSVTEGADATGNVLTGVGTTSGLAGADTAGADGFGAPTVVGVAAGSNTASPVSGGVGGAGIAGVYGTLTLNANGSYTYAANPDAVTSNQTDTFVYTIVDGDGDLSTTTLAINVANVTVTAADTDALVNEAGLPVVGSNAASNSEIFNGAITPSSGTGPYTYTLTSSANGAYGNLVLNPATGSYTYTLDTTYDGATLNNGVTTEQDRDSFSYTVTDANGNSTTGTILVDIIDDVPTARADTDSVTEGADATGNVLTGVGTTSGLAGADTAGADGFGAPTVVGVAAGSNTASPVSGGVGGAGIAGVYGTLTLNANGSYTYAANPDAVTSNQTDTFVYTIADGDGDLSTTTLAISVNNVTVTASDTDALVNEAGLPVVGSNAASNSEIFNGAITPSSGTGPYTYTLTSSANGAYGNLVLNPATGSYTYTLDTTYDGATLNNGVTTEQDKDSFSYTVTDANGNSTTGTILVDIIDDVPTARADTDSVTEGADATGNVLTGVGTTSGLAGADTAGADGFGAPTVVGVAAGSNTASPVSGGVGGAGIAGVYGTLTLNANGSYTYAANPDAVTSNQTDTFVYTIVDGDGDLSTTTLAINVANVTVTAADTDALVNEAGLPVVGSNAASNSEIFNGAITPSSGTGPYTYTLTSSANGAYGNLVLNPATGSYTYTLDTTYDGATLNNGVTTEQDRDSFSYTVTDANGNTATGTILVDIIDDVPIVLDKTDLIYSNSSNPSPGGTGVFDYIIGADSRTTFSLSNSDFSTITLSGVVGLNAVVAPTATWASETTSTAVFDIAFDYAKDPTSPGTLTHVEGTLTFDKVAGTYTVVMDQPIESFSILQTSAGLSFTGYEAGTATPDNSQPAVAVTQLNSSFFVQFSGVAEPGSGAGANNLFTAGDGTPAAFANGDKFTQAASWVSVSNASNGVGGDTMGKGEVLDFNFYDSNPFGNTLSPTATATGIFLQFDGIVSGGTANANLVVILKLIDPDDGTTRTTRAIIVDSGDVYKQGDVLPTGYVVTLDNNDGVVFIESNDYNLLPGENWVIEGAQVLSSTEGVTGTGINLVSSHAASTTYQEFEGTPGTANPEADTVNNDGFKITNIGITTQTTTTQDASLTFQFSNVDADGDTTATQTLNVTIEGSSTFTGTANAESIMGGAGNDIINGLGGNDILIGGSGNDTLTGGTGSDRFVITSNGGVETITDFTTAVGGDILDISDVFADAGVTATSGNIGTYLTFDTASEPGVTKVFIDLDAGGGTHAPVQVATLQGSVDLTTLLGNGQVDYTP